MWNKISNWWNKEKIELQKQLKDANERLDNTLRGLDQHMALNQSYKTLLDDEKTKFMKLLNEHDELKQANPDMKAEGVLTPWLMLGVNGENELKGLKTYIDWNDALIQHMKDKNLGYKTEEEMVQHFIAQLYEHMLLLIENRILEDSDQQRKNEFE